MGDLVVKDNALIEASHKLAKLNNVLSCLRLLKDVSFVTA